MTRRKWWAGWILMLSSMIAMVFVVNYLPGIATMILGYVTFTLYRVIFGSISDYPKGEK